MPKKVFRTVYALNFVFQAGFSLVCPAGLLTLGGWLLHNRCGWGRWVLIVAIILGVLIGFYSMFQYVFKYAKAVDPTQEDGNGKSK